VLDVLRETVVELHHEVVEDATPLAPHRPLRLAARPEAAAPSASRRSTGRRSAASKR
jgi:hypothetical protein